MNAVQLFLKRLGLSGNAKAGAVARSKPGVAPTPLLMALEPRVVYDASVAALAQPHAAPSHAAGDAHAGAATANDATVPAAPRTVAEHDVGQGGARNGDGRHGDGGQSDAGLAGRGRATDGAVNDGKVGRGTASGAASGTADTGAAGSASAGDAKAGGSSNTGTSADLSDAKVSSTSTNSSVETQKTLLVADAIATDTAAHSVVFIDPSVSDIQALIAGLPQGTQYVVLNAGTDGFAQMADYLQAHPGADAIHLISHGSNGMIQAGSTWLNASALAAESAQLTRIGAAMNPGGDFLIYGCDVAQNADGQLLVREIASLTHLNVAASTDATGAVALGGDWTLEYQSGTTHTAVIESAAAQAQYSALLGVTTETYDVAAANNFGAVGQSQFALDGVVYTFDQPGNTFAYNALNWPYPSDISMSPTDGVLEINADGASTMRNVTISLANGHLFSLQGFDLSSFNGDLYIQANYADGSKSALIQLATAVVGGFEGNVSNQNQLGTAFNNIVSFSLIDQNDTGSFEPTLNNLAYVDNGPSVATSSGSAAWVSSDNGVGGTAVAVDPGITLTDPGSASASTATVRITNVQSGDQLSFVAQNGITGSYDSTTGILLLTGSGSPSIATWQAALQSITFFSTQTSPSLSTATRTVSFSFNDGIESSNVATRTITVTATGQTPLVTEGGAASTGYIAGTTAVRVDTSVHVSDADSPKLASGTVAIGSGYTAGDTLAFNNSNSTLYGDIIGNYDPSTHKLTMTSVTNNATAAQWQNAFEAVTFSSAAGAPGGTRDITFSVSDGTKTSALLHHSMVVTLGPTVSTDIGSAAFVSGDNATSTPVAVDSGILLADGNSSTLVSATVAITGNFQVNHDELVFIGNPSTMGNISGVYDSGTGVLTLTSAGGASLPQWQNALSSIRFTNDLVVPSTATRTVSFQINDGTLTSAVATRTVTVTAVDQTPLLGHGGNTAAFVAGDNTASTPVTVNNAITVSDADGGPLHQAVITIAGNYEPTDVLAFINNNTALYGNISATYVNGTLTLSSSGNQATLAQWRNALGAVTYTSTAVTPGTAARTISFAVSDGTKTSTAVTSTVTVTDTDQTPVIGGSTGSVTFTQGDNASSTPIVIDGGITISDRDNSTLTQANVVIASGYDSNGDFLLFISNGATMGNITGSYSSGVLVLTSSGGTATLAQWQAALRSVTFADAASTPSTTQRVINFVITDGVKVSSNFQRTINVVLTDQSPIVTDSGGTTAFTSADNAVSTPVVVDAGLTLTDADTPTMVSASVAITGNYHIGEDVLALGSGSFGDIQAVFDAGTGVLTLTSAGASTIAQWQAALRSVTYTDTAVVPQTATRTITFSANDGTKSSVGSSKAVSVTATHQTPVLGASGNSVDYLPGQVATNIDSGITLTDRNVSGSALVSMSITVQVTSGLQSGDTLGVSVPSSTLTNGMIVTYDGGTGTLTITSTGGTIAQWQTVLDNLQFSAAVDTPLGTRTLSITISDGVKTSQALDYNIDVISSAPALGTSSSGSVSFVAGDNVASTPVTVDANLTLSDPLGNVVDSAVIAITGNLHSGEDLLSFVNDGVTMGNITGNYNQLTGVMTLISSDGSATLAQWQSALRSVTYTDMLVTPNTATRTVSFSVNAGPQFSNVLTRTITVAAADQTPLLSTSSTGTAAFVAGDNTVSTPVTIDTGISISDLDNGTLVSATVQIGTGFHAGEDVLGYINDGATMGNIVATYDAVNGTLTLSSAGGSATLAQWQAALRAVTYTDTAITPDTTSRSISFIVNDGVKSSLAISRDVTVADTDQTPIVGSFQSGPTHFVAGDNTVSTPVAVDTSIVLSDLDNVTLATATVRIDAGFHAGEDVLSFVNDGATMGNIFASYDAATGTLTMTSFGSTATIAQWQSALRSVTYINTAITPATATRSIGFTVNDNIKTSATLTRDVTVVATDQTPVLDSTSSGSVPFTGADNTASTPVVVDSGIQISDLDNASLASATVQVGAGFHAGQDLLGFVNDGSSMGNITASYNAATGTLTLTSAGASATLLQWQNALHAVTYTNTAFSPDTATRTIGFSVNDGSKSSAVVTRDVTVTATDQTPVIATGSTGAATFVAGDSASSAAIAVDASLTVSDHDNATLASATVRIGSGFHAGEDVLAFANDGATMGNIRGLYNAATGILTLTSDGATATVAQWQAALRAVTYTDTASIPDTATRTIGFTISDGTKTSAGFTRQVAVAIAPPVVVPPQPPAPPQPPQPPESPEPPAPPAPATVDPAPPALISLLPPSAPFSGGNGAAPGHGPAPSRTQPAPDTMLFFPRDLTSTISSPLIVIDAFADAPPVGMPPMVTPITFAPTEVGEVGGGSGPFGTVGGQAAHGSLSRTTVDAASAIPVPDVRDVLLNAADQSIRVNTGPNEPFSVSLPLLAAAGQGVNGANAHVEVRQANGQPLPGWVRFDPVRGTMSGKTPPHGAGLHIQIIVRDSNGNQTQRDLTIEFGGRPGHADAASVLRADGTIAGLGTPAGLAARDVHASALTRANIAFAAKPSLTEQFARAHATLHVARPAAVSIAPAAPAETAATPQA